MAWERFSIEAPQAIFIIFYVSSIYFVPFHKKEE